MPSPHAVRQERDAHRIRSIDIATGVTTTLAGGNGRGFSDGGSAQFKFPLAVAIDPSGTFALVAVRWLPIPTTHSPYPLRTLYKCAPPSRRPPPPPPPCTWRIAYAYRAAPASQHHAACRVPELRGLAFGFDSSLSSTLPQCIPSPHAIRQDRDNHRIRSIDIATGETTTLAGTGQQGYLNGDGASAKFDQPMGVAIDPSGTFAIVSVRRPPPYPLRTHKHILPSRRRSLYSSLLQCVCPPPVRHRRTATAFAASTSPPG